jgi:hypothetical protein
MRAIGWVVTSWPLVFTARFPGRSRPLFIDESGTTNCGVKPREHSSLPVKRPIQRTAPEYLRQEETRPAQSGACRFSRIALICGAGPPPAACLPLPQ